MRENIRTIHYGLGPIGAAIARLVAQRPGFTIVGGIDIDPAKAGRDIGEAIGLDTPLGVTASDKAGEILANTQADIVVHTTGSFLKQVRPQLLEIIEAGLDIVSTCEELAYPWMQHPAQAYELDRVARQHKVTVVGTGVNPGFIMDTLPIALTAVCQEVRRIRVQRIVDASQRRLPLQRKIGAGLTAEEFAAKVEMGTVKHVGLPESVATIADALGWRLDRIEETIEPLIADRVLKSKYIEVRPGQVAGLQQIAHGRKGDETVITLDLRMQIGAEEAGDSVFIEGTPNLEMVVKGIHGDVATAAIVVNAIPRVIGAPPGLLAMKDLPPACAPGKNQTAF